MTLKKNLFAALVAGCVITLSANTSFGWHHGGSCGSWGGGWGSHGSYGGWGSCGSYGGGGYGSGGSYGGGGSCGSYGGGYAYYGGYYGDGYASTRVIYDGVVSPRRTTIPIFASAPTVKTSLTLHVPAEAKITLAGVDTKQTGEVRQFATNKLAAGQTWDGYKIVAEIERNGKTVREERMLKLIGGEAQEVSINFDSTKVAKN